VRGNIARECYTAAAWCPWQALLLTGRQERGATPLLREACTLGAELLLILLQLQLLLLMHICMSLNQHCVALCNSACPYLSAHQHSNSCTVAHTSTPCCMTIVPLVGWHITDSWYVTPQHLGCTRAAPRIHRAVHCMHGVAHACSILHWSTAAPCRSRKE
jgi:hypothetical protein